MGYASMSLEPEHFQLNMELNCVQFDFPERQLEGL